ncbi:hypothetical protein HAX54_022822 [Datura stramonium]|uniref:Uncharacterized protein n=1 Tax=Datura stramonium TaxID=4076 RepID=A0ABS8UUZ2_DATST|nr:hypothetical protein [Datura stramonium]
MPLNEKQGIILAIKQKIVELSSQAKASQVRERQSTIEYAGIKTKLDALLASEEISPCPSDVIWPPQPPQYRSIYHYVYDQYNSLVDEPNSDEDEDDDEDDHVENTPPHY